MTPRIVTLGAIQLQAPDVTVRGLVINRFDGLHGIQVLNTDRAIIEGNFIGTDPSGTRALGLNQGVRLQNSNSSRIGGNTLAARNLISGNFGPGIRITTSGDSPPVSGNIIQGNLIGVGADGSDLGNGQTGIILKQTNDSMIGGIHPHEGNVIAFNREAVSVSNDSTGNSIRGNSIFGSDEAGLNLYTEGLTIKRWVNANDPGDVDEGGNHAQNFPVISDVQSSAEQTTFTGYLSSMANTSYQLDFYANTTIFPLVGYGEGQTYLGSGVVTSGPDGIGNFSVTLRLI